MKLQARIAVRPLLLSKVQSLTGEEFQKFFSHVMSLSIPGFINVRTHGNLGDESTDGFSLCDGKLYACYAPEVFRSENTVAKLQSDLKGARAKHSGQFSSFVFVHNDLRGIHPDIYRAIRGAQAENSSISIELMGYLHIRDLVGLLTEAQVEDLIECEIPLHAETSVGMEEMAELLEQLSERRTATNTREVISSVSEKKLAYSNLSLETQSDLRSGMKFSTQIDDYYQSRVDVLERDDVAARFHDQYLEVIENVSDPEDILFQLQVSLAGTRASSPPRYRASMAVLAYFFQTCDIFEDAPDGWESLETGGVI